MALVFFVIDTFGMFYLWGISIDMILDLLFHIWVIYYLVSGSGTLTYDGVQYPMQAGDVSVCLPGHSHGFAAAEACSLIVVGSK